MKLFRMALLGLVGCNAGSFDVGTRASELQAPNARRLDMLFMIDNSSSMTDAQNRLLETFPGIMNVLKELPGGLPDLHVAVISRDMGTGAAASPGTRSCCSASRWPSVAGD